MRKYFFIKKLKINFKSAQVTLIYNYVIPFNSIRKNISILENIIFQNYICTIL